MDTTEVAAALRRIAAGFEALAAAVEPPSGVSPEERTERLLAEWGDRGLSREEASALFRRHGFAPQAAGGWVRGDWLAARDGLRYLTPRSREWLAERRREDERHDR